MKVWIVKDKIAPKTIMRINDKERMHIQISLYTWSKSCVFTRDLIDDVNQWCFELWDYVVSVI